MSTQRVPRAVVFVLEVDHQADIGVRPRVLFILNIEERHHDERVAGFIKDRFFLGVVEVVVVAIADSPTLTRLNVPYLEDPVDINALALLFRAGNLHLLVSDLAGLELSRARIDLDGPLRYLLPSGRSAPLLTALATSSFTLRLHRLLSC